MSKKELSSVTPASNLPSNHPSVRYFIPLHFQGPFHAVPSSPTTSCPPSPPPAPPPSSWYSYVGLRHRYHTKTPLAFLAKWSTTCFLIIFIVFDKVIYNKVRVSHHFLKILKFIAERVLVFLSPILENSKKSPFSIFFKGICF